MVQITTIQSIRKYGNSLIVPITKQAKELDLKAGDVALITIDNGLKTDTPLSFNDYIETMLDDSKRFAKTPGSLFLTVEDSFWQTPEILKRFVDKRIKKKKDPQKDIRLSDIYTPYDVYFRFTGDDEFLEVVIDHDGMKTTFKQLILWMWIESVEERKYLIVECDGYDYKRSITFVTDCTTSEIPQELIAATTEKDSYGSIRNGIIRYLEHIEEKPSDNQISDMEFYRKCFNIPKEDDDF